MVDYRAWVATLGIHLRDEDATHPSSAPHKYRFDQWLNNIGRDRYTNHPALARIVALHERIHREADELVNLKQHDYANTMIRFSEIETLRDQLLVEMERLIW